VTGDFGESVSVVVQPVNPHQPANAGSASPASAEIALLDPDVSYDDSGIPAWQQDIAGTDPLDPNDLFMISDATADGHFQFMSKPGRVYTLYYSDDSLTAGETMNWIAHVSFTNTSASATAHEFTNVPTGTSNRFFRLRVERQP
jgi:hypothetical protein